ncbi:MAG: DUF480 domain-containing protein [Planctomycetaceae bacterium]|nr:DUF480 domain-containing protein [Planctomycetaceae bacterium]
MSDDVKNEIRQLNRTQRRVIGVLMEKAFTTPDQYPLTLKATTTGCNQKNNRDPVTDYSESQVADALEALRQLGLIAEVFTDGGRAARYRHYMRHKFDFSETQFAVIAELLLRGRQQPGELRTRASRMVKIESQEQLKADLQDLQEKGFIQANGALERRGVEVDHTFYMDREGQKMEQMADEPTVSASPATPTRVSTPVAAPASTPANERTASGHGDSVALNQAMLRLTELTAQFSALESTVEELRDRLERLESDLGG